MIRTSERLKQGARIYYQQFIGKVAESKHSYPSVDYPNKVDRFYFQRVSEISDSKVEIVFLQRTFYKKVEGYRQVNYQKYRILSNTLYKEKNVSIKIDLTPTSLNNLKHHINKDVEKNALGIISAISRVDCYPSWAQSEFLDLIHKATEEKINNEAKLKRSYSDSDIKNEEKRKNANKKSIELSLKSEEKTKEDIIKTIKKVAAIGFGEHKVLKTIFTLGINNPYWKYRHLKRKAEKLQSKLDTIIINKNSLIIESHNIEDQLVKLKNARTELEADIAYQIKIEKLQHALDNSNISQPFYESFVNTRIEKDHIQKVDPTYEFNVEEFRVESVNLEGFVDIDNKNIATLKGLNIIGVYAVRNVETSSIYIGLSFDVEKSISGMFNNYVPIHPLMLKEYQESKLEDKTKLFETKIKMVSSKEELTKEFARFDEMFNGKYVHF